MSAGAVDGRHRPRLRAVEPADLTDTPVDFDRFGGLDWVHKTDGRLSFWEGARLLGRAIGTGAGTAAHMLIHAVRRSGARIDSSVFELPTSRVARAAEEATRKLRHSSPVILQHSYRAWMLGTALAILDEQELDRDLFYCAALLHDYGLAHSKMGIDFTVAGSELAFGAVAAGGRSKEDAKQVADGICVHPTVGISVKRDGAIGYYLQWGSMADIAGLRRGEVPADRLDEILMAHGRGEQFKEDMAKIVSTEARSVPRGRFALYKHFGMTLAARWLVPDWRPSRAIPGR